MVSDDGNHPALPNAVPDGVEEKEEASRAPGLSADVWEYSNGAWELSHQFNSGLELDWCKVMPSPASKRSRVHLPTTSLDALQKLRKSLHTPGATVLEVEKGKQTIAEVHSEMLAAMAASGAIQAGAMAQIRSMLVLRAQGSSFPSTAPSDIETQSVHSETLVQPDEGKEGVDVSVCQVPDMKEDSTPSVCIARMEGSIPVPIMVRTVPMRYFVLVLCPQGAMDMASKMGEAFATTCMDEEFAGAMRTMSKTGPEGLLATFDKYVSTLTIVPTVRLYETQDGDQGLGKSSDTLLSDTIVNSIEDMICDARGIEKIDHHSQHHPHQAQAAQAETQFFVEVDEFETDGVWRMTHRLRQGLEIDAAMKSGGIHLPRVSVSALAELRQIMTASTVALDVTAECALSAVNAAIDVLRKAQLPEDASDELARALVDRAVGAGMGAIKPGTAAGEDGTELLTPSKSDEACQVLAITCKDFPRTQAITGAFLRFKSPLRFSFPSTGAPVRFLLVFVGPERARLSALVGSLAGLAADEVLMGDLSRAGAVGDFVRAFDARLDNLLLVPHARLRPQDQRASAKMKDVPEDVEAHGHAHDSEDDDSDDHVHGHDDVPSGPVRKLLKRVIAVFQKWQVPLVSGVLIALIWSNADVHSYEKIIDSPLLGEHTIFGHGVSLHFIVNDMFMVFFFGLAIKEVTEALLPGGSLSPLRRAVNPLMATLGGVVGPAVCYLLVVAIMWYAGAFDGYMCQDHLAEGQGGHRLRRLGGATVAADAPMSYVPCDLGTLLNGWGVPCATDISLAWMFALLIFGAGHPAINFLLLLAIVDDAIGMVIIAVVYKDPSKPVEPVWLLLVLAAMILSFGLRKLNVPVWWGYVFTAGPISWLGLLKAHVHPALALVFVVPFIPAEHALHVSHADCADLGAWDPETHGGKSARTDPRTLFSKSSRMSLLITKMSYEEAPLHVLEHSLKLPVDLGMFFFGLANAGVQLSNVGHLTTAVLVALIVGKTVGIAGFSLAAGCMGFALPAGVTSGDLWAMSALGGVGLTVALFVANEAFVDPNLQGQAKFAAVLSIASAAVALGLRKLSQMLGGKAESEPEALTVTTTADSDTVSDCTIEPQANKYIEEALVGELRQVLWVQRRYQARGVTVAAADLAMTARASNSRNSSKISAYVPARAVEAMISDLQVQAAERGSCTPKSRSRPTSARHNEGGASTSGK